MSAVRYFCACCLLFALGCTTTKTSNTARTGTEQLLISNAVDQALAKVDFTPMAGKKILVEEKYMDCTDKGYIISSIRHHVVHSGGILTAKPEEADIILELRSGGVGTDTSDSYVGMPGLTLPGMVTLPDVKFMTRSRQSAFAKLGIVAIDNKTHREMDAGGTTLAMSDDNNWYFMGVGPYRQGSMEQEVKKSIGDGSNPIENQIPAVVSFKRMFLKPEQQGGVEEAAGRIQLTSGEQEQKPAANSEVQPANHVQPANQVQQANQVQPAPPSKEEPKPAAKPDNPAVADKAKAKQS